MLDGVVSLDDPIGDYIEVSSALAVVTIGRLASHTSGLSRLGRSWKIPASILAGTAQPYRAWSGSGVIAVANRSPIKQRGFLYSNLGFALLGEVLASAAGRPYVDVLHERVFAPIGMTASAVIGRDSTPAPGHDQLGFRTQAWVGADAAGGIVAAVGDVAQLLGALIDPGSPIAEPFRLACTPPNELAEKAGYGLGWAIAPDPESGATMFWHNGGTAGYTTFLGVREDRAAFIAVDRGDTTVDASGTKLIPT